MNKHFINGFDKTAMRAPSSWVALARDAAKKEVTPAARAAAAAKQPVLNYSKIHQPHAVGTHAQWQERTTR